MPKDSSLLMGIYFIHVAFFFFARRNTPFIIYLNTAEKYAAWNSGVDQLEGLWQKTETMWYLMLPWETALQERLQSRWTKRNKTDTGIE